MSLPSLFKATSAANLRVVSVPVAVSDTVRDTTGAVVNANAANAAGFAIATLPAKAVITGIRIVTEASLGTATLKLDIGAVEYRAAAVLTTAGDTTLTLGTNFTQRLAAASDVKITIGAANVAADYVVDIQYYLADAADVVL